ncbi:MAG: hypothetical protein SF123_15790 [Chloroflexota bacterium]|nr:hypothetical protein [Chloroflexota bacterium]
MNETLNGHGDPNETQTSSNTTTQVPGDMWDALTRFAEHQRKAVEEAGKAIDALFPPGFKEHGTEARREFVKGFKVLVDTAISEMEKASREIEKARNQTPSDETGSEPPPSTTGRTKVKVQVD